MGTRKERKTGSGRPILLASIAGAVDPQRVKAMIDKHRGVQSAMVDDIKGQRALGLIPEGSMKLLTRMTLKNRLDRISIEHEGRQMTATEYANLVRVEQGRPGPNGRVLAGRTKEELAAERVRLVEALARTPTLEAAAGEAGYRTRAALRKRMEVLKVSNREVELRRQAILGCDGCRGKGEHVCGVKGQPAA